MSMPPLHTRNELPEIIRHYERNDPRRWVPLTPGASFFPYLFDVSHGAWHVVFRVAHGAQIPRHYHTGRVVGCTLAGQWRYKERDWVHKAGSYLLEVPGDMHTFETVSKEDAELFVMNEGSILSVDDDGQVIAVADVTVRLGQARAHYRGQGLDLELIDSLVR